MTGPWTIATDEVERTINGSKNFRAVVTRHDKRAYVFHGTVTVAAIQLWLRPQFADTRSFGHDPTVRGAQYGPPWQPEST